MPVERLEKWKELGPRRFDIQKARMCLVDWGKLVVNPSFRVRSIDQVFEHSTPSLITLNRYGDERITALILQKLIHHTEKFFKVSGRMDKQDSMETAFLIIDEYPHLTIADFKLCFQHGKAGKYGKLYDRFDGAIIMEWLSNYSQERSIEAERQSFINHHNTKSKSNQGWSTEGKELMKDLLAKLVDTEINEQVLYQLPDNLDQVRESQIKGVTPLIEDIEHQKQLEQQLNSDGHE